MTPLPNIQPTIIKTTTSASRFGVLSILKFVWKHLYLFSIIFFLLPTIISSIQVAKATNNPIHPLVETGLTVINADDELDKEVNKLKENPVELMGTKPEAGLWNKTKYYWNMILLYWEIIGYLFLISIPFKLIYSYYKYKGDRAGYEVSVWENLRKTLIVGIIIIFFVNLLIVIVEMSNGSLLLNLPQDATIYKKAWLVVVQTFPFHGTINLISYLISLTKI